MHGEVHISNIIKELSRHDLLPAIVFRTSRSQCDMDANRAAQNRSLRLSRPEQAAIKVKIQAIVEHYDMDLELITSHPQYASLITSAVGAHHAGQLLHWRLLLEELMVANLLRVLVATGTVAAGVDFPARSVVVTAHSRRGAEGFLSFTSAEFQQMSGRAGRRGKDSVGFCFAAPSRFCDARELYKISQRPPEPLRSSYFPSPSTVLNLLRYRNVDDLRFTVSRSLASFIDKQNADDLEAEAEKLEQQFKTSLPPGAEVDELELSVDQKKFKKRIRRTRRNAESLRAEQSDLLDTALRGLDQLGFLDGDGLSKKGFWSANLCTGLVLELAEMIQADIFADASIERLLALVACVCGDSHRQYLKTGNDELNQGDIEAIGNILTRVSSLNMPGVFEGREVQPSCADTVLTWMKAESWQEFRSLLILSKVAEGDAARIITQTADHLNQLMRLSKSHPELALRAEEARFRILRPPLTEVINVEEIPAL